MLLSRFPASLSSHLVRRVSVRMLGLGLGSVIVAACTSVAGVDDFEVDPAFEAGSPETSTGPDTSTPFDGGKPVDGSSPDTSVEDAGVDAPVDANPPPSPGLSSVTTSGTGVMVGRTGIVTLVAKNAAGDPVARTGGVVVFTATGGTSVVTFGAVTDVGDGTYRATFTGVTEGTKLSVSATLDGAALTTPAASLRVANPVATNLTFSLDARDADGAGNFGGKNCGAAGGLATWKDLTAGGVVGTLSAFADPCSATSGWLGTGAPDNPFRLLFDGVDDHVDFGAVNSLTKQTLIAWIRRTGAGLVGESGTGGLAGATPILSKGTAQGEGNPAVDVNYFLAIGSTNVLATDFEADPGSGNAPLLGVTALSNDTWYMVALTLDSAAGTRSLWLNGAVDGTLATTAVPASASGAPFVVGGSKRTTDGATCPAGPTGCARFKGDIAAVLTYDRALTQAEMEKNCHAFSSRFGMMNCPN